MVFTTHRLSRHLSKTLAATILYVQLNQLSLILFYFLPNFYLKFSLNKSVSETVLSDENKKYVQVKLKGLVATKKTCLEG